ncbi:hypothetical protein [Saccharopolyspora aridisoli]|uniref:hypothetical protein n=1 Tax=Saccharopolyspora aridisoli TaxID=2530385 RepID=UPI001404E264|nr:hypothetical protein [Saccharopolyspora aridisoli]
MEEVQRERHDEDDHRCCADDRAGADSAARTSREAFLGAVVRAQRPLRAGSGDEVHALQAECGGGDLNGAAGHRERRRHVGAGHLHAVPVQRGGGFALPVVVLLPRLRGGEVPDVDCVGVADPVVIGEFEEEQGGAKSRQRR